MAGNLILETTYEQFARSSVAECHELIDHIPNAVVQYSSFFLEDYETALNSPYTSEDLFLKAYAFKALAERYGASSKALDQQAYEIRQAWARGMAVKCGR